MWTESRRNTVLARVGALLRELDPGVTLLDALLDSTRQQLVLVMQKGEYPVLLGMSYLDYASHRDEDLKVKLKEGLARREAEQRRRESEER
jgi:hypothetical protein